MQGSNLQIVACKKEYTYVYANRSYHLAVPQH